jgi:hypothetical protein
VTHQTGNLKASFSKIFSARLVPEKIKENLEVTQLTNESNRRSEGVIRRLQLKTQFAVFLPSKTHQTSLITVDSHRSCPSPSQCVLKLLLLIFLKSF